MDFDPIVLARIQFAFTIAFHILFPAFTIGLAAWIAVLEGLAWGTGKPVYDRLSRFWTKIFAVSFGMGVVSGIVMSFQFGTNWSELSQRAGNVLGPLLSYEVITAFFLEATFLGVLLFGRDRVPKWVHFTAACAVGLGTFLSSFWILSANSWMHTPDGYRIGEDGIFYVTDWWAVVFNPSFPYRLAHMVTAAFLTTSFAVAGASAWQVLHERSAQNARTGLSMAIGLATVLVPLQIFLGDLHGLNTLEYQPAKVAAMEGHWEAEIEGAPLVLFALPDEATESNRFEIGIPKLSSLILTHDLNGKVQGLKAWPPDERPNVPIVFWSFRIMVGLGFLMLAVVLTSLWLRWRGRLADTRCFLRTLVWITPIGFVALLAGWVTTEVGRQPWVVYGLMRTVDAATPGIGTESLLASLGGFVLAYGIIFPAGLYYIIRLVRTGAEGAHGQQPAPRPKRPLSGADGALEPAE